VTAKRPLVVRRIFKLLISWLDHRLADPCMLDIARNSSSTRLARSTLYPEGLLFWDVVDCFNQL
jgi:hypothetical protein